MLARFPKDDSRTHWTRHIKDKMVFYRLGEGKIKAVIKSAERKEEGVAPNTYAVMKRNDTPKRKEEIWVMFQQRAGKKIMISAWRYPGKSKPGAQIPIPDDVLEEIKKIWF